MNLDNLVYADQILNSARGILSERDFDIFESNLVYGVSFQKLANEYEISASRVGQIIAKSIRKTLNHLEN